MASASLRALYRKVRASDIGFCATPYVVTQWRSAVVLRQWDALESLGAVRLMAEWDQDYERSEDDPEDIEAYTVLGQFRVDFADMSEWSTFDAERDAPNAKHWHTGDCIGGCAGYDNVLSPFENPYVIDIMAQTIDAFREEWKHYLSAKADRSHGRCPHCHGTGRSYFQG